MGQVEEGRPRLSLRRKAVLALSDKYLLPIPGGFTAGRKRQAAQVDGPRAVCMHYFTETCCR